MSDYSLSYLGCLTQLSQAASKSSRCVLRLLDTVFIDENLKLSWYFTTGQSLSVAKKKESNTTPTTVLDRFEKFALANPRNILKHVAVLVHPDGQRELLKQSSLRELLNSNLDSIAGRDGCYLQVYQRPHDDFMDKVISQEFHIDHVTSEINSTYYIKFVSGKRYGDREQVDVNGLQSTVTRDITDFSNEICKFMLNNAQSEVQSMSLDYIVDESNHAWVINVPEIVMVHIEESTTATNTNETTSETTNGRRKYFH